ncbi:hypothetical protein GPALN_004477 [Globodera pallida]|nr:hypothetical protein GPALN_004477 [Globodera pallida]
MAASGMGRTLRLLCLPSFKYLECPRGQSYVGKSLMDVTETGECKISDREWTFLFSFSNLRMLFDRRMPLYMVTDRRIFRAPPFEEWFWSARCLHQTHSFDCHVETRLKKFGFPALICAIVHLRQTEEV